MNVLNPSSKEKNCYTRETNVNFKSDSPSVSHNTVKLLFRLKENATFLPDEQRDSFLRYASERHGLGVGVLVSY